MTLSLSSASVLAWVFIREIVNKSRFTWFRHLIVFILPRFLLSLLLWSCPIVSSKIGAKKVNKVQTKIRSEFVVVILGLKAVD